MNANKILSIFTRLGQFCDGQCGCVRPPDAPFSEIRLKLLGNLMLELDVFEYGLNDKVTARKIFIIGGGFDQTENCLRFLLSHTTFGYPLLQ